MAKPATTLPRQMEKTKNQPRKNLPVTKRKKEKV
jgi:hypothetical protein